jgi:hypothetical protein
VRYPDFRYGEDTAFLVMLSDRSAEPIHVLPAHGYLYRRVQGSLSDSYRRALDEQLRSLDHLAPQLSADPDGRVEMARERCRLQHDVHMLRASLPRHPWLAARYLLRPRVLRWLPEFFRARLTRTNGG